jgi:aspartate racemase
VPDRTVGQPSGEADPLPWLRRGVQGLQRAGCGAIAIPCNTAHRWYDAMCDAARVPILHIVDAAATELRRVGITSGRCGVMATEATVASGFTRTALRKGWDCIMPQPGQKWIPGHLALRW